MVACRGPKSDLLFGLNSTQLLHPFSLKFSAVKPKRAAIHHPGLPASYTTQYWTVRYNLRTGKTVLENPQLSY